MIEILTNQTTTGVLTWVGLLLTILIPILMASPAIRRAIVAPVLIPIRWLREPYDIHGALRLIGRAEDEIADLKLTLQMPSKAIGFVGGLVLGTGVLIGMALFWSATNDPYRAVMVFATLISLIAILASVSSQLDRLNNPAKWLQGLLANLEKRKARLAALQEWGIIEKSVDEKLAALEQEALAIQAWVEAKRKTLPPALPTAPKPTEEN